MRHHGLSAIGTLTKLAYALVLARLATSVISTPLFFVSLGLLAGPVLGLVGLRPDSELLVRFLQAALGMMLFVDASSLDLRNVSLKAALAGRLLVIGLPLMVLAGGLVAVALWPGIALWQAALVGAMLAPTDALLAHAAVADPRVPAVVRNALNVEGGLDDGLALPIVTTFIAIGLAASGVDTQVRAVQALAVPAPGTAGQGRAGHRTAEVVIGPNRAQGPIPPGQAGLQPRTHRAAPSRRRGR